jgi:hypothetical protein
VDQAKKRTKNSQVARESIFYKEIVILIEEKGKRWNVHMGSAVPY